MRHSSAREQKLSKARIELLLTHPFFAALCLRLKLVPKNVPTMETDGRAIYYGEQFVDSLTFAELVGVLAHEAMHCALGHHCRRASRMPHRWNQACDYAINPLLIANGFTLPAGGLLKSELEGLSAEEIYARLAPENGDGGSSAESSPGAGSTPDPSQAKSNNSGAENKQPQNQPAASDPNGNPQPSSQPKAESGQGPAGMGDVLDAVQDDGSPASEADKTQQERDWKVAAEQAAQLAKSCGNEPLGVDRALAESRESQKDWRAILREFIASTNPTDYRFSPPNRRFVHAGLYLPSIYKEGTGSLVIAVDTSGSIGLKELEQFAGEVTAIAEQAQPEVIHVVYCDAAVQSSQEFAAGDSIALEPKGGGGTNFRPVFEWVEANNLNPVCLLYLTDLICSKYPPSPPDYPVLWVTDSRRVAPFGETLQILADE